MSSGDVTYLAELPETLITLLVSGRTGMAGNHHPSQV